MSADIETVWGVPVIDGTMTYVGVGGHIRKINVDFELGQGCWRVANEYGIRRAIWDIAFGYVSGFRKRDIAYYVLTRSLSRIVCESVIEWEAKRR